MLCHTKQNGEWWKVSPCLLWEQGSTRWGEKETTIWRGRVSGAAKSWQQSRVARSENKVSGARAAAAPSGRTVPPALPSPLGARRAGDHGRAGREHCSRWGWEQITVCLLFSGKPAVSRVGKNRPTAALDCLLKINVFISASNGKCVMCDSASIPQVLCKFTR